MPRSLARFAASLARSTDSSPNPALRKLPLRSCPGPADARSTERGRKRAPRVHSNGATGRPAEGCRRMQKDKEPGTRPTRAASAGFRGDAGPLTKRAPSRKAGLSSLCRARRGSRFAPGTGSPQTLRSGERPPGRVALVARTGAPTGTRLDPSEGRLGGSPPDGSPKQDRCGRRHADTRML